MFNLAAHIVIIPIADIVAIIPFDASDGDGGRHNIFSEIFCDSLSTLGDFSLLHMGDKSLWILFPSSLDIAFDGGSSPEI